MKLVFRVFWGSLFLMASCNKKDSGGQSGKPSAKFSISGYEMTVPCTVSFINISSNASGYEWDFGDGSTSTLTNPTHVYNFNGSYILKLKATGPGGIDSACKLVSLEAPPPVNKSAFSYFQEKCSGTPVGISFKTINPLSTNPAWDFGSGTTVLSRDPIEQFLLPGDYTIKYSTQINGVRDTLTRIIRIN